MNTVKTYAKVLGFMLIHNPNDLATQVQVNHIQDYLNGESKEEYVPLSRDRALNIAINNHFSKDN